MCMRTKYAQSQSAKDRLKVYPSISFPLRIDLLHTCKAFAVHIYTQYIYLYL